MKEPCIIICRGAIEDLPPILSLASSLSDQCDQVTLLASTCADKTRSFLAAKGVEVITLWQDDYQPKAALAKIKSWLSFRRGAFKVLTKLGGKPLLWLGSADTALALGHKVARWPYVLQLNELYDAHPFYKRFLRFYARNAKCVVVPEHCRAGIYRQWYDLQRIPMVIPNKPASHPRTPNQPVSDERARDVLAELGEGAKILLYQGHIQDDRDIRPVARAVDEMGGEWRFLAMGHDWRFFSQVAAECPAARHIPNIPAPYHLEVTSRARVGLICYEGRCLNELFCAPNKVWEYSGFGLPILCQDLPSLRYQVAETGAGRCVDFNDIEEIKASLKALDDDYAAYRECALRIYDNLDIHKLIGQVLAHVYRQ